MARGARVSVLEMGQGSGTTPDLEPTPAAPPATPPPLAPMMIGAEQVQQLLGGLPKGDDFSRSTKNFSLYGGTRYDGLGGVLRALSWVEGCEEAFARLPLTSPQKRELATQHLDGPTLKWWRAIREGLDLQTFGWEEFILLFYNKFVPLSERNHLSEAFINLR